MNNQKSDIELIERHFSGKLSHEELVDFETRLEEDHEFARKFRLRKSFPSLFNAEGDDMITQAVEELRETTRRRRNYRTKAGYLILFLLLVAALVISLLLLTGIISFTGKHNKPEPVIREQVKPAVKKPVTRKPIPVTIPEKPQQPAPGDPVSALQKSIILESPDNNMIFSRNSEIVFRWKMETDTFTRLCVISDIGDRVIWWRGIIPGIQEYMVPASTFKPGRFFWYVGSREVKRTIVIKE
ncbi:MAG: hypothetical protein WCO93_07425 [bacterium]